MTALYKMPRPTVDVDCLSIMPYEEIRDIQTSNFSFGPFRSTLRFFKIDISQNYVPIWQMSIGTI